MSAFLVNNSTISKLADALRIFNTDLREKYSSNLKLAQDLYDLNVKALKYKDYKEIIGPFCFTSEIWALSTDKGLAQFYMSLRCFLYQCCEGKVPESKLYKELEKTEIMLSRKLAIEWAEEEGAIWE